MYYILCTEYEYVNTNQTEEKNDESVKNNSNLNISGNDIDSNLNPNLLNQSQYQRRVENFIAKVNDNLTSICSFKSKKLDVGSYNWK